MDIPNTKLSSNLAVLPNNTQRLQSNTGYHKPDDTNVSVSSLALRLEKAQQAIDSEKPHEKPLSWDVAKGATHTEHSRSQVASAKWTFEHLSKDQLETIALDPSDTFSNPEKVAAYERWHAQDQADLSDIKRDALKSKSHVSAMASFDAALTSHIHTFSAQSKAMISDDYKSQATSHFESTLNEPDLMIGQSGDQSEHYYAVMVKNIFGGNEPEVQSGVDGMSLANVTKSPFEFLTQDDRNLLADIYQYADQNDIDYKYIHRFASDLGGYRKHDDGNMLANYNDGHFDAKGHQLTVNFTEKDQATIDRLRATDALASTPIDKGFLSFITEPGQSALSHVGNYQFLHHMVEVTAGAEPHTSVDEFKVFEDFSSAEARYVMTASEKTFPIPEPDVVCKNGNCAVTEKGLKNGVTLEQGDRTLPPAFDFKSESMESLLQLRENKETQEKSWFKWFLDD
ncbi:hypothetical protein [Pseudoalteromonas sp. MMG012]|uniref:hypothetical protein n=1 Tax=Pseudoalteromonas sp. MMG012 TaxID=2822686 RepID=UPI001B39D18B|nr:hypothetical protein [Pseudoalteromonas sp. MMG012]MBQ4850528.1 hypothetical protein [Pseudoalteromonas sp. MMG012]